MSDSRIVLDSSAYLAFVHLEPGHEIVEQHLMDSVCVMSVVNLAEVLSKQAEIGVPTKEALALLSLAGVVLEDFSTEDAEETASLRIITRAYGLSLGDRSCLALGLRLGCPILTADQIWKQLNLKIDVRVIR